MAFDQSTRNRLQRFVNDARKVQEEEFTRQLQNDYGLDPISGTITPLENLRHLNDAQRETARILRDTLAHYCASQEADAQTGLERIVREQAFTVLNRLAALRMAEARGLLIESVGNGYQAKGFQLYARLAGTGLGETGDAYRVYLFSVFDELAQDLPGLFDRYSPQGRLFPREASLLQLLALINDAEIEPLWAEDETIGWIYQYFNSREERRAMRDASQAPRNSRELAVRNQFFTPRYVVEFLVDNTLGRLWFNATGGKSALAGRCQYLLVKPDEKPVVATRLRDPRTLKLLDPACGSMHFGLYAFDRFLEIYREAWNWEQEHGPGSLDVSTELQAALKPLSQTYENEKAFLRDVPRLIIEHNIYGVDIDPRAAQIASLALWLRAQRAWHDAGVKAKDRPLIGRGHVVAAIAPPAERELRVQFAANLDQRDAELFEKTLQLLKGLAELGVLLQVERELPNLIRQVYVGKGTGLFAAQEQESWQLAEARLRTALTEFAHAAKSTYQGRLFAQDTLQGLRIIDICRLRYDVVVMNPPFGDSSPNTASYLGDAFQAWNQNLLCAFWSRAAEMLRNGGRCGAIFDRTAIIKSSYEQFRRDVLLNELHICSLADLGWGVLDANVETVSMVCEAGPNITSGSEFFDVRESDPKDKGAVLLGLMHSTSSNHRYEINTETFKSLPNSVIGYDIPPFILQSFSAYPALSSGGAKAHPGLQLKMDAFGRLRCEVHPSSISNRDFVPMYNGGSYSPFYIPIIEMAYWKGDGAHLLEHPSTRWNNGHRYFQPGIGYGKRGYAVDSHILPAGCLFTIEGLAIFPSDANSIWYYLGLSNSRLISVILNLFSGQHKHAGYVDLLPIPPWTRSSELQANISRLSELIYTKKRDDDRFYEISPYFCCDRTCIIRTSITDAIRVSRKLAEEVAELQDECNESVERLFELDDSEMSYVTRQFSTFVSQDDNGNELTDEMNASEISAGAVSLISYYLGCVYGRWDVRYATSEMACPELPDPFSQLPVCPPGQLQNSQGLPATSNDVSKSYPLTIAWNGVLVDDVGHEFDIEAAVQAVIEIIWRTDADANERNICSGLNVNTLRQHLRKPAGFFSDHLRIYSKGNRKAPIYWPLSTASSLYTLWVYYPSLTNQTLYTAINDFIEPKLKQVGADVTSLCNKGPTRTRDDEKQFETLQAFELEMIELRDTLLKLAPSYKPNHDDGVQITAAPLWPLFRHKPWQKVLKDTWAKLEIGDYDWAHLAMSYWPARVREKCKTDKSLAIAHDLEALYVEPEAKPKKTRGKKNAGVIE